MKKLLNEETNWDENVDPDAKDGPPTPPYVTAKEVIRAFSKIDMVKQQGNQVW